MALTQFNLHYRKELYPSVEEKAAMLLYLVTKNHSFSDGNKRIAATLFLWLTLSSSVATRQSSSKLDFALAAPPVPQQQWHSLS